MGTKTDDSVSGKNLRVWCTPSLVILGVVLCFSVTIISAFLVLWGIQDHSIGISCLICVVWVGFVIAMISLRREVFAALIFEQDGISFPSACRKREFVPYKQYRHVYLGCYGHGMGGFPVTFIVFSQRYISASQLHRVNELSQSTDVVKLRFSKRRYKLLRELLPVQQRIMLEREFAGLIGEAD